VKRAVLAVVLALGLPATASASTVSVIQADGCAGDMACSKYGGASPVPVTTVQGAPGEANRIAVSRTGGEFLVRDDGATLTAVAPCTSVDAHSARCPVTDGTPYVRGLAVDLGDGDDQLAIAGDPVVETSILAGPGTDLVQGGDGNDRMTGGPGDDRLLGGGGFDELLYATEADVVVDLARGTGGEAGEADTLAGFETLVGGDGDDVLTGASTADIVDGGEGADVLRGGGGADRLFGGLGADALLGQAGDDELFGDPGQGDGYYTPIIRLRPDRLVGGRGDDKLYDTGGANTYLGGPGRDFLEGGAGPDAMDAGSGRDRISARAGGRDRVRCGSGLDRARLDRRDAARGCERVTRKP
jgi:Ca2+-binding RTX toxin-like protein